MSIKKRIISIFIIIIFSISFCGCWDYIEMNDVKYIAGMAVDRDKYTKEYILTIEVLEASVSSQVITSSIVEGKGPTIHTALRDSIKKTGQMLQASHSRAFIVSKEIATEGIITVLDLINRDAEVRSDMALLIAKTNKASDILTKPKETDEIISYEISDAIKSSKNTGEYGVTDVFKFIDTMESEGISSVAPMVDVVKEKNKSNIKVSGTAIFKGANLIGQLSNRETIFLEILREKNPKFVIPIPIEKKDDVSLELRKIKRKAKLKTKDEKIAIDLDLNLVVYISEIDTNKINYIARSESKIFKTKLEQYIEKQLKQIIEKIQKQYGTDILGIGKIIQRKNPRYWKKVYPNWDETYKNVEINPKVNINIKYTGLTNKNLDVRN